MIVTVVNVPSHVPVSSTTYKTWLESKHHASCTSA